MRIPLVDLKMQYQTLKSEIDTAIQIVIDDCSFIGTSNNTYVKQFENEFALFLNAKYCVGCANGTDSLEIILEALGICSGDEVIVPALTWFSTSEAVSNVGATPVFVDIDPESYTIDVSKIELKINAKTKAIIPVHLYGHPADMPEILLLANKYQLKIIEDCAQAHGASIQGKMVGTFGDAGSFSFFPGKNLGAYGDAGCIVTNNEELAINCRIICQHGQPGKKHVHIREGRNSRLDGIQASILSVKLKYLSKWTEKRIENAKTYSTLLREYIHIPKTKHNYTHVYHLFSIESSHRNQIIQNLNELDIEASIYYPTALPFLDAYKKFNFQPSDFPIAFQVTQKIIEL